MSTNRLSSCERAAVAEAITVSIRHETRNKLASVRNAVYYIQRRVAQTQVYKDDPRLAVFFTLINGELEAVNELVSELVSERLGSGGPRAAPLHPTLLHRCVESGLQAAALPGHIQVALQLEDRTALAVEAEELTLLVRCLIDNAAEAMPAGGCLTIRTYEQGSTVVLCIEDTGPGFTKESRLQAFKAFYSDKPGHLGLGLSIARGMARRNGAQVSLGEPGHGARVDVVFATGTECEL